MVQQQVREPAESEEARKRQGEWGAGGAGVGMDIIGIFGFGSEQARFRKSSLVWSP